MSTIVIIGASRGIGVGACIELENKAQAEGL